MTTTPSQEFDTKEYWNTRLADKWDLAGVGYRSVGAGFNYWAYAVGKYIFKGELARLQQPAGSTALDIGAGTGFYTQILASAGYRVSGIDISPFAVAELRKRFPYLQFKEGRGKDISGSYDLICAMAVLFHIIDDEEYRQTLRKIHDCLTDEGVFIFTENFPSQTVTHTHIVMRSEAWLLQALEQAGLVVVSRHSFGALMNEPVKRPGSLWWNILARILQRAPALGWLIGAILYPLELLAVKGSSRPSSEIVVCRRRP